MHSMHVHNIFMIYIYIYNYMFACNVCNVTDNAIVAQLNKKSLFITYIHKTKPAKKVFTDIYKKEFFYIQGNRGIYQQCF
jgi:hypothetical protein